VQHTVHIGVPARVVSIIRCIVPAVAVVDTGGVVDETSSRTAVPPATGITDLTVNVGLGLLLVVCTFRYFEKHPVDTLGVAVVSLAVAVAVTYLAAVVGASRGRGRWEHGGIVAATALWIPLAVIAPSYGWCAFALFFAVHRVLHGRPALVASVLIVVSVSTGLLIMSRGQDLGLVLGPLLGGVVMLFAYRALNRSFDEQRALVAELRATQAQLAASERDAGAFAERHRVASELHDTAVQSTASALLLLETAHQAGGPDDTEDVAVGEARRVLRGALAETRQVLHGLTVGDDETGMTASAASAASAATPDSLAGLADRYGAEFHRTGGDDLPPAVAHTLFRVVQEALRNTVKHADATTRAVHLEIGEDMVTVSVTDDGVGFDVDGERGTGTPRGYGLRAMAWRIGSIGGDFAVTSSPGEGTVVSAAVPLAVVEEGRS
jgi:signal transduction histidine kinase